MFIYLPETSCKSDSIACWKSNGNCSFNGNNGNDAAQDQINTQIHKASFMRLNQGYTKIYEGLSVTGAFTRLKVLKISRFLSLKAVKRS